ncbi:hypothetical protein QBC39DRAFT_386079 [Podospora conica]|nr:hypothetical protein QBC39DRAFT_386079 [Schizothecium conicum]
MNAYQAGQPQASVKDLLKGPQGVWRGLISSHQHCDFMVRQLEASSTAEPDQDEDEADDFPHTPEAKQECARQLFMAMTDFSDYTEAKDGKNHHQVNRLKLLSGFEMELLSWKMLEVIENTHKGCTGFEVDQGDKNGLYYRSFGTFGARFNAVKDACRRSKSIVYNLTTPRPMHKLASDPIREIKMKINNKILNDKRAVAKLAAASKEAPVGEGGDEPQLDDAGSSNAANENIPEADGDQAAAPSPQPQPKAKGKAKAKRPSRQNNKATQGGRVAKARAQKKKPSRGAAALAARVDEVPDFNNNIPDANLGHHAPGASFNDRVPGPNDQGHAGPFQQPVAGLVDNGEEVYFNHYAPGSQNYHPAGPVQGYQAQAMAAPVDNVNGQVHGAQPDYPVHHGAPVQQVVAPAGQMGAEEAFAFFENFDWELNPQEVDPVYQRTVQDLIAKRTRK